MTPAGPLVTGHFDANAHQGNFGEAFLCAVAAAAGLNTAEYKLDIGDDYIVSAPGPRGTSRMPKIEVQVKSWANPVGDESAWSYPLKVPAYNHLAGAGHDLRHYLVLCVVPNDAAHYAIGCDADTRLHHALYWHSLRDEAPDHALPVNSTKAVYVSKKNLLTTDTLVALVEDREGEAVTE